MIPVKFKRLCPQAVLPTFATPGAACFDLRAVRGAWVRPGAAVSVPLGLAVELPPGFVLLIFSRSGHGARHGVRLGNCVGVIDSDYRGELMAVLRNDSTCGDGFLVSEGDRCCQGLIIRLPELQIIEVDELSSTERGEGGFGSTGNA